MSFSKHNTPNIKVFFTRILVINLKTRQSKAPCQYPSNPQIKTQPSAKVAFLSGTDLSLVIKAQLFFHHQNAMYRITFFVLRILTSSPQPKAGVTI